MSSYKVSILVTFYNQEQYVEKAMNSIFSQKTDFCFKVIVGDDGSTDKTREKVREWIEKYPEQVEMHVMDRGEGPYLGGFRASQNRLNLLKHVDTDYFIYLDGDDYYNNDIKLQKQVDILDDPANADCICCGHNACILYLDGTKQFTVPEGIKECKFEAKQYWAKYYCHTDSLLIRSSVIDHLDKKLLANDFNDNVITFNIIQFGKMYYIPECWITYLQTGEGIWTSKKEIINWIRNSIVIDICNIINPKLKKQTYIRLAHTWKKLYQHRKNINSEELKLLDRDAQERNLVDSYNWIHYNELSIINRFCLLFRLIYIGLLRKTWKMFNR